MMGNGEFTGRGKEKKHIATAHSNEECLGIIVNTESLMVLHPNTFHRQGWTTLLRFATKATATRDRVKTVQYFLAQFHSSSRQQEGALLKVRSRLTVPVPGAEPAFGGGLRLVALELPVGRLQALQELLALQEPLPPILDPSLRAREKRGKDVKNEPQTKRNLLTTVIQFNSIQKSEREKGKRFFKQASDKLQFSNHGYKKQTTLYLTGYVDILKRKPSLQSWIRVCERETERSLKQVWLYNFIFHAFPYSF